jgi:hypothetical protein
MKATQLKQHCRCKAFDCSDVSSYAVDVHDDGTVLVAATLSREWAIPWWRRLVAAGRVLAAGDFTIICCEGLKQVLSSSAPFLVGRDIVSLMEPCIASILHASFDR